jgi:hypothetical protein
VVYSIAAVVCVVAPALASTTVDRVVLSYVLLAGVPVGIMAILLALIHSQHRLIDRAYRATALMWAVGVLLVLTPFEAWLPFEGAWSVARWTRAVATALIAGLFMQSIVRIWSLRWEERIPLALGFGSVAIFFGYRAGRYVFPPTSSGLESMTEALANFFLDAVVTCLLLLPALASK